MSSRNTRRALMEAAAAEILDHGFAGASLSAIAARLGLTKGALAHHFPTKASIASGLATELEHAADTAFTRAAQANPDSPLDTTIAAVSEFIDLLDNEPVVAAAVVTLTDRSSPTFADPAPLRHWTAILTQSCASAQAVGELGHAITATELAEYLAGRSVAGVVFGIEVFPRRDGAQGLRHLRLVLATAGATDIDQRISRAIGRLRIDGTSARTTAQR